MAAVATTSSDARWYHRCLLNRAAGLLLLVPLVAIIVLTALQYHRIEQSHALGERPAGSMLVSDEAVASQRILNDYDDFYVVGRLHREGEILRAYDNDYLLAAQQRFTGAQTFMPWAYPPQLTALVPLLPMLGMGWSFLIFMSGTLALYFAVLRSLNARAVGAAMLAVYPALLLDARLGQNGFLTAALIGLFLRAFLARRDLAGVPLGLMAIKPHLAITIGFLALLERRWRTLAIGITVVVLTSVAATAVLGTAVWPAFLSGARDAGAYLREGLYPLYRMSSAYAGVRSFGSSPGLAMAVHVVVAVAAIALLALAWRRGVAANRLAALAATTAIFVSPYNYDYDLACLAVALALVADELFTRMNLPQLFVFYALAWIGSGWGLFQHLRAVLIVGTTAHPHGTSLNWSLQGAFVLLAALYATSILRRGTRSTGAVA